MDIHVQTCIFVYVVLQHSNVIHAQWDDGTHWNDVSIQMMDKKLPSESKYYDESKRIAFSGYMIL